MADHIREAAVTALIYMEKIALNKIVQITLTGKKQILQLGQPRRYG